MNMDPKKFGLQSGNNFVFIVIKRKIYTNFNSRNLIGKTCFLSD